MNPSIFREYDIRGVVGTDITPETAEAIARARRCLTWSEILLYSVIRTAMQ